MMISKLQQQQHACMHACMRVGQRQASDIGLAVRSRLLPLALYQAAETNDP